jgi:hypothetical protein
MNEALEFLQTELYANQNQELQSALNTLNSNVAEPEKMEACNYWVNVWNSNYPFNNELLTYEAIVTIQETVNPNGPTPVIRT